MIDLRFLVNVRPITKKNSQRIIRNAYTGRAIPIPSKQYKQYERDALIFLKRQYRGEPINEPVNVKCLFYIDADRKVDITNLLEAIDDVMVEAGILADDNRKIIAGHDGTRVYVDRIRPRTEIFITSMMEDVEDKE